MSSQPFRCCYCNFEGQSLSIFKGGTWNVDIEAFVRDSGVESEYSLDGFTGRMQIRQAVNKPVILEPTVTIANNRINLFLTDEETNTLDLPGINPDEDTYVWYDLFLDKDEESWKVMEGEIRMVPSITQVEEAE